jgi:multiple sugar transport system permease protein
MVFIFCFPLIFLLVGSFMGEAELQSSLAGIVTSKAGDAMFPPVPQYPTLMPYINVLVDSADFFPLFWNSVAIVALVLLGQMLFALPAAWAFARYEFRGRRALFFCYILVMMMPFQVMMLPEYLVLNSLGLLDSIFALVIPGVFSAFPVFILYHFFKRIPTSIFDAARVDGASEFSQLVHIGIPLAKPGIFATLLLGFLEYWNLIEQPLVFLRDKTTWPISLFLPSMGLEHASIVFVTAVITSIPAILVFLLGREYLEQGIGAFAKEESAST